jgi:hypothetical protein
MVLVLFLVREVVGVLQRVRQVRGEAERLAERMTDLERDIDRRRVLLERMQDSSWMTYQARLRLNYKLPGEHVVVVYKKEKSDIIASAADEGPTLRKRSWWSRLTDWFR